MEKQTYPMDVFREKVVIFCLEKLLISFVWLAKLVRYRLDWLWFGFVLVIGYGSLFLWAYHYDKNHYFYGIEQGLQQPALAELRALAAESQPNPNRYISSRYSREHPLFWAVYFVQEGSWALALHELQRLAQEQPANPEIIYWLGVVSHYGYRPYSEEQLRFFHSALSFNTSEYFIYSCFVFQSENFPLRQNSTLDRHFKSDREIKELCEKPKFSLLKLRREQGDVLARYNLWRLTKKGEQWLREHLTITDFDEYVQIATQAAQQHCYYPLLKFLRDYKWKSQLTRQEDREIYLSLLMLMANNHYIPAILLLEKEAQESADFAMKIDLQALTQQKIALGYRSFTSLGVFEQLDRVGLNSSSGWSERDYRYENGRRIYLDERVDVDLYGELLTELKARVVTGLADKSPVIYIEPFDNYGGFSYFLESE